jgi:hypothetical protein
MVLQGADTREVKAFDARIRVLSSHFRFRVGIAPSLYIHTSCYVVRCASLTLVDGKTRVAVAERVRRVALLEGVVLLTRCAGSLVFVSV